MATVHLYRIDRDADGAKVNAYLGTVTVDADTFDAVRRGYRTPWLDANGYPRASHFLRERRMIETTEREREAFARWERGAKALGLLPSAADRIICKVTARQGRGG